MVGRKTSILLQVFGLIGLIGSIVLAAGILLGRSWASDTVGQVFVVADSSISDGLATYDDATGRLNGRIDDLDALLGLVGSAPANSPVTAAIAARIGSATDGYAAIRDRYVQARERAQSALRTLAIANRIPGLEVSTDLSDSLAQVDSRLTQVDAAVTALRTAASGRVGDLAAAVTTFRDRLAGIQELTQTVRDRIVGLQDRVVVIHGRVDSGLWLGAGALLVVVAYVALLNLLIIWLARRRPKVVAAAPAASAAPTASVAASSADEPSDEAAPGL
jgi:hypothetical protein